MERGAGGDVHEVDRSVPQQDMPKRVWVVPTDLERLVERQNKDGNIEDENSGPGYRIPLAAVSRR